MYDPAEYPIEPPKFPVANFYVLNTNTGMIMHSASEASLCEDWVRDHGGTTTVFTIVGAVKRVQAVREEKRSVKAIP